VGRITTHSAIETEGVGRAIGRLLPPGAICLFYGDLGSGKTTLIKGLISERCSIDPAQISSPTFTYMTPYGEVNHFDLYRLSTPAEFCQLGLEEELHTEAICCVEWPDRIVDLLPGGVNEITLSYLEDGGRTVEWEGSDLATLDL